MKHTFSLLLTALTVLAQTAVYVNVGGTEYTDGNGQVWQADTGCSGGSTFTRSVPIAATDDDDLYIDGIEGNSFSCQYTVTTRGFYYITFRMAETLSSITTANPRLFNIFVNGANQRGTINIRGATGVSNTAYDLSVGPIAVFGTTINSVFSTVSNPAVVQAISIELDSTFVGANVVLGASSLITQGAIPFVSSTPGTLTQDTRFTFNTSGNTFTAGSNAAPLNFVVNRYVQIEGDALGANILAFRHNTTPYFALYSDPTVGTGELYLSTYDAMGMVAATPLKLSKSTGILTLQTGVAIDGTGTVDFDSIAAPSNPSGDDLRFFANTATGKLECLDSVGTNCLGAPAALAANPTDCAATQFATAIAANGNLTCAQPAFSDLSGAATDAQIPDTITINQAAALTANPSDCASEQLAHTIAANGNLTCRYEKHHIQIKVGDGSSVIATGDLYDFPSVDYSCTLTSYDISAKESGSIEIDLWKKAGAIPAAADEVQTMTLTTAQLSQNNATSAVVFSPGDVLGGTVVSATTVTRVTVDLWCE